MQATLQSTCSGCGRRPADHSLLIHPDGHEEPLCFPAAERDHQQHRPGWLDRVMAATRLR